MLNLHHIAKSYRQGDRIVSVLRDVNFEVQKGKTVAIMGRSGSGKSTLLSLISGILKFDAGEIELDGRKYSSFSEEKLSSFRASHIGFVFQNFHLVSYLNALENVMLPAKVCGQDHAEEKAQDLLQKVGLEHRVHHLPRELSGGEKQRVAIARALIHGPKLILADEPSGSLDEHTGEEVMNLLFQMVKEKNTTLVLVTHDKEIAKRCEKTLHIEEGQVASNES